MTDDIEILDTGIAVIRGDSHCGLWVKNAKRLDHDTAFIGALCNLIPPGGVVVDAGAYIGDHTVAYLKKASRVLAFEPNPVAHRCLCHNCPDSVNYNMALGRESSMLWWVPVRPNYGASYLSPRCAHGALPVPVETLDSFRLPRLDFLKADVEGHEVALLHGAEQTIARCRPAICVEVNVGALERSGTSQAALLALLDKWHYSVAPFALGSETGPQWDAVCTPR